MAARLMPPPGLKPALQRRVLEPEVRIEVVGEDGVFGCRESSSTAFDLAGQELLCHALKCGVNQVVDVRALVADEVGHVIQQVSGVQVVGFEQGQKEVGIEIAAVKQRVNEAVCVHGGMGEVIKHALPSPSPLSLVVKVEPPNSLDRAGRRRYARSAYRFTSTRSRLVQPPCLSRLIARALIHSMTATKTNVTGISARATTGVMNSTSTGKAANFFQSS